VTLQYSHIPDIVCFMSELEPRLPDNTWFEGQVASWEGRRFGYRALLEVIIDPGSFREIVNSAGDDELVELHDPKPGHKLKLTYLDEDGQPRDNAPSVVLDTENPTTIIPHGSRFEMDASASSDSDLAYTCIVYGERPLVE